MYFCLIVNYALSHKSYLPFYITYLLFLVLGGIFLFVTSRENSHLILNQFFYDWLHSFFKYITHIGDGLFAVAIILLVLFVNYKSSLQIGLTAILAGGATQLLKNFVFDSYDRPSWFFKHFSENRIQTIEGMELNIHNSFPSGHTTTAFALYVSLLLLTKNPKWTVLFTILAFAAGYSRVYLSQHFFIDIYFGSLMGTLWALLIFAFLSNLNKPWFNKSLINR
jgi:membrane-associated phospholipid phosphatase